jgi:hypothetical protein
MVLQGLLASGKIRTLSSVVPRDVNMFWVEKFMVILDCCQVISHRFLSILRFCGYCAE